MISYFVQSITAIDQIEQRHMVQLSYYELLLFYIFQIQIPDNSGIVQTYLGRIFFFSLLGEVRSFPWRMDKTFFRISPVI